MRNFFAFHTARRGWRGKDGDGGGVVIEVAHFVVAIADRLPLILGQPSRRRRMVAAHERRQDERAHGTLGERGRLLRETLRTRLLLDGSIVKNGIVMFDVYEQWSISSKTTCTSESCLQIAVHFVRKILAYHNLLFNNSGNFKVS